MASFTPCGLQSLWFAQDLIIFLLSLLSFVSLLSSLEEVAIAHYTDIVSQIVFSNEQILR